MTTLGFDNIREDNLMERVSMSRIHNLNMKTYIKETSK
jgi:hypothetical protein